ncbi:MAG: hypothetical protein FWB86_06210 [Treponema sp.]|nr:hypothetical protein [Treponema sp.]MCL2250772.1 hypothetical protein [Treponema sp.]
MKKLTVLLLITVLIVSTVSAQGIRDEQNNTPQAGNEINRPQRSERRQEVSPQAGSERRQEVNPQARGEQRREFKHKGRNERRCEYNHHQSRNKNRRDAPNQFRNNRPRMNNAPRPEAVTVSGILKLERGFVAVQTESENNSVLIVPALNRYIGFINGLNEGTNVSVEGFRFRNMLHMTKLTIGDRAYDFSFHPDNDFRPNRNNYPRERQSNNSQKIE